MNDKLIIGIIGGITVLIFVLGLTLASNSQPQIMEQSENAEVEVLSQRAIDLGEVDINGGDVEIVYEIRNSGTENLYISNVETSCGCTKAQIAIGDKKSGFFGMNTVSGWQGTLEPGQTAQVRAIYDPLYHGPQGTGPFTRIISMNTNDASNPVLELRFSGTVVK